MSIDKDALGKALAHMIHDAANRATEKMGDNDGFCKERFLHGMQATFKMDMELDRDPKNRVHRQTSPTGEELYNLARKQVEAFIFGFTYGHKEIPGEEEAESGEVPDPT